MALRDVLSECESKLCTFVAQLYFDQSDRQWDLSRTFFNHGTQESHNAATMTSSIADTAFRKLSPRAAPTKASLPLDGNILEAWAEGFNVGALVILILIVVSNIRRGVILHKLILLELVLALWHGTFIFFDDPQYGWYLSATAALLFISYQIHNVVAWLKIKPFLPRWGSMLYIISLLCVQPFWVVAAWLNFEYFNNLGVTKSTVVRPWEALARYDKYPLWEMGTNKPPLRDPWWIFTTCGLVWIVKRQYNFGLFELIKTNTRFGVLIFCMFLSVVFLTTDIIVTAAKISKNAGINPYWRLALVFKCASDVIFLDDFKKVLDSLHDHYIGKIESRSMSESGFSRPRRRSDAGNANRQPSDLELGPTVTIRSEKQRAVWERIINAKEGSSSKNSSQQAIRRDMTFTMSREHSNATGSSQGADSEGNVPRKPSPAVDMRRVMDLEDVSPTRPARTPLSP
ncbi:MAG: hypothetical protein M1833_003743 [Piccolia ochrophora]|nr:MAG: hypothetical protein M1833_003743 [Piccolia ochrophora]